MGRDLDGVFAELVAVDEHQLLRLPPDLPYSQGPLLQILGTCVHGQDLVQADPGQVAVVNGLGVSGLLHVQLLRARGVDTVIGVTRSDSKLKLAQQLGATAVATPDRASALVEEITGGEGADLLIESSGTLAGLRTVVQLARPGATLLLFGTISDTNGDFPYYLLYLKELSLMNSRGALPRDYAAAIDHVATKRVRLEPLLSHQFPLIQAATAMEACGAGNGVLKMTMHVGSVASNSSTDALEICS
jgi:L-iditol 2-dehydrogenase